MIVSFPELPACGERMLGELGHAVWIKTRSDNERMAFKGGETGKSQIYCSEYAYIQKNDPLLCEAIIPSGGILE